jgi:hypothetical protein
MVSSVVSGCLQSARSSGRFATDQESGRAASRSVTALSMPRAASKTTNHSSRADPVRSAAGEAFCVRPQRRGLPFTAGFSADAGVDAGAGAGVDAAADADGTGSLFSKAQA